MLIREEPATELTVATRVLAHADRLGAAGRVVLLTGEVVYVGGAAISNHTMTPYDVAIVRLRDGLVLVGDPPTGLARYLDALRERPAARAAALTTDGTLVTAESLHSLVAVVLDRSWDDALDHARAVGALIGAYPLSD